MPHDNWKYLADMNKRIHENGGKKWNGTIKSNHFYMERSLALYLTKLDIEPEDGDCLLQS